MTEPDKLKSKIDIPREDAPGSDRIRVPSAFGASEGRMVRVPEVAAVMPTRDTVIFPGTIMPLAVGREKSRSLLNDLLPDQKVLVLVAQRDAKVENPTPDDLYTVGTAVLVLKLLRQEDGTQSAVVHGLMRVRVGPFVQTEPYFKAEVTPLPDKATEGTRLDALVMSARQTAGRIIELSPNVPEEARNLLGQIDQPGALADFLASNVVTEPAQRQELLEETDVTRRLLRVAEMMSQQLDVLELSDKIQEQVRSRIDKTQREYFLQEQLKAIQKELGQGDERTAEVDQLRERVDASAMPPRVRAEVDRELTRMARLPQASPEYSVLRTYMDVMLEMPWGIQTEDHLDIRKAQQILDADHHDLEKVKRRIIEYLSVRKLRPQSRGALLCFMGPPGVGKTSLGQSIARALGRKFIRMSLGGVRDEAELRGHRRTYIGALPGRIVQELRRAGSMNPVFMLDEVDKMGADFRGDPTSALLEILDPAQNDTFRDHYLGVELDLSRVMFIATGNYLGAIPPALRDRMEIIELPGYAPHDKLDIAEKYLVPRQLRENGLEDSGLSFTREALETIIQSHTREAGVRDLERQIGAVCRGVAAKVARSGKRKRVIRPKALAEYLGPPVFQREVALRTSQPGVATGLAYTPYGGDIIFIEATLFPGHGRLELTGQIGHVMRESAQAAFSLLRSRADDYGIDIDMIRKHDVHIHVPAGAIPKDGPSAGVGMIAALVSLFTNHSLRHDVAMTGEITLRGLVLPVGGIKQKTLAARMAGIQTVILPRRNEKDLGDLPPDVREGLQFAFADTVDEVLDVAIEDMARVRVRAEARAKARVEARQKALAELRAQKPAPAEPPAEDQAPPNPDAPEPPAPRPKPARKTPKRPKAARKPPPRPRK